MTEKMLDLLEVVHNYLDRADVVITNEYYWYLGTVEVIAKSIGMDVGDDEIAKLVRQLMGEY